jgi:hypothetical protein
MKLKCDDSRRGQWGMIAWEIEHSVETDASQTVAWSFWTNVANWSDPPAEFELDGPFAFGSCGTTRMPGQPPMHWIIREVQARHTATIEGQIDGAIFSCQWRFEAIADGRTRLTQRLELRGENAAALVTEVDAAFRPNIAAGMQKIAAAMADYARERGSAG